jgi:8-oxo-dGTP diphosphatase/2-hydroxy-dATP diphosphatase
MSNLHLPPGLSPASFNPEKITELVTDQGPASSYEETAPWMSFTQMKQYTNAFVVIGDKILLGMKKRGIGEGMWNGFGGKPEPGETILQAAYRELKEECGIQIPLVHAGRLLFLTETVPGWGAEIEVYRSALEATEYVGEVTE